MHRGEVGFETEKMVDASTVETYVLASDHSYRKKIEAIIHRDAEKV
jgi:hypothetical protein